MTARAKRAQKALEAMGWDTGDYLDPRRCETCGLMETRDHANFCGGCSAPLPKHKRSTSSIEQLERAIAYALGETATLPKTEN